MKINQIKVLALLLATGGLTLSSCKGTLASSRACRLRNSL